MPKSTRRTFVTGGLIVAATGAGLMSMLRSPASAKALTVEDVLFDPVNPVLGNPEGDVTIVEFFDYQCPYCKTNHPPLTEVVKADGNIRLVMKDWPIFGAPSVRASQLVLGAASLGRYEDANTALMETEGRLDNRSIDRALGRAGFDVAALDKAYRGDREKWDALLSRNSEQASLIGLRGTPAFIVGEALYAGAMGASELRDAVATARG
ncbi:MULTISPECIES: DsbA family protein [Ponticoccus]|uniref:DsbA family protein n=1 Tax=Ponticoccus litoralis TaxID=422297 RepID=A0AAW9SJK4_9RHOB